MTPTPEHTTGRSRYVIGTGAALVIAAILIGGVWWTNNQNQPLNDGYGSIHDNDVLVTAEDDDGVVTLGKPDAPTVVDFYSDPLCPGCAAVESRNSQALAEAVDNGDITVRYHTLNFLDRASASGDYSTRAGAALLCLADAGDPIAYSAFRDTIFHPRTQPAEHGTTDLTNTDLADLAHTAGASADAVHCITTGTNYERATTTAHTASNALKTTGSTGTPTATAHGTLIDFRNKNWISTLTP